MLCCRHVWVPNPGMRVVSVKDTYGGTNRLFLDFLPRVGVEVELCDTSDHEQIEAAIVQGCRLVYLETPTNPTLKVMDIARLAAAAHAAGAIVVADNTLAVDLGTSGAKVALDEADAPSLPAYQPRHAGAARWGKGGDVSEPPSGQYRVYGYRWVVLGVGLLVNLIQLFGQVSVVFVYVMAALRTADGSFTVSLVLASGLLIVGAIASSRLKDAAPAAAPAGESTVV